MTFFTCTYTTCWSTLERPSDHITDPSHVGSDVRDGRPGAPWRYDWGTKWRGESGDSDVIIDGIGTL